MEKFQLVIDSNNSILILFEILNRAFFTFSFIVISYSSTLIVNIALIFL